MTVYQRVRRDAKGHTVRGKWVAERMIQGRRQRLEFDSKAKAKDQENRWKKGVDTDPPVKGPRGGGGGPLLVSLIPAACQALYADKSAVYRDDQEAYMRKFCVWAHTDASQPVDTDWTGEVELLRWKDALVASKPKRGKRDRLAPSTINSHITAVRALLDFCHSRGRRHAPTPQVRYLKVKDEMVTYLEEADEDALVAKLREVGHDEAADFVRASCMSGMRLGELLGLHPADVRPTQVFLRHQKNGKVGTLAIAPEVGRILKRRLPWTVSASTLRRAIYGAVEALGWRSCGQERLERFRLHSMRHTMGTRLNAKGVDLPTIQALMRHATIKMTTRYVHAAPEREKMAIAALSRELPEEVAAE